MPNKNPFKIALAVRKKELEPEVLRGAAKRIYNDNSLTDTMLEDYASNSKVNRTRIVQQNHSTFKY